MPVGTCRLCQAEAELQLSHVIPAFAFRWQRQSSGNGFLRASDAPNKRVQDGEKFHWLCSACEERFSVWEGEFANKLFHPVTRDASKRVNYSKWLLLFCASLSWRVVQWGMEKEAFADWPDDDLKRIHEAETVWRDFLLGKIPHPGRFQQHILPVERMESATGGLVSNINRYLMRAIHIDVLRNRKSTYTYTKIGRFIVYGFVHESKLDDWKGTKINANEGIMGPRKYVVPGVLWNDLTQKATKLSESLASMSEAQQAKVDAAFSSNVDKFIDSDAYHAVIADLEMFGKDALRK